jgi:hypothetical protein
MSAMRVVARVLPGAAIETDAMYLARLRKQHGRKHGFWHLIDQTGH